MKKIIKITEKEQFNSIRPFWNKVVKVSKDNSFFLTWEHIAVSVKHLTEKQKLYILILKKDGKIISIAPLRRSQYFLKKGLNYNIIEPLDYGTSTDYNGFILTENYPETFQLYISYLFNQNDWDFIQIYDIPEESNLGTTLIKYKHKFPKFELSKGSVRPYIDLPDSIDAFLQNQSRNFRKNIKRRLKLLKKDFRKVELKNFHDFDSIEEAINLFFELHQKRWQSLNKPGAFHIKKARDMFLDRAKNFAEKGWFGLYFLVVDDKPIAAKYVLEYNKKIYGCLSGFDPEYSSYSVGHILLMKVIESGINRKFIEYDFMKGDEQYKFNWTKKFRNNLNLRIINTKLKSKLINFWLKTEKLYRDISL